MVRVIEKGLGTLSLNFPRERSAKCGSLVTRVLRSVYEFLAAQCAKALADFVGLPRVNEPPRFAGGPFLRGCSHDEQYDEQVFTRGSDPSGSDGSGSRLRARVPLGL